MMLRITLFLLYKTQFIYKLRISGKGTDVDPPSIPKGSNLQNNTSKDDSLFFHFNQLWVKIL